MSATGGLAPEATTFYRRLASLLGLASLQPVSLSCFCGRPLRVSMVLACSSISHFHCAPPSLDLTRVEFNIIINFDDS